MLGFSHRFTTSLTTIRTIHALLYHFLVTLRGSTGRIRDITFLTIMTKKGHSGTHLKEFSLTNNNQHNPAKQQKRKKCIQSATQRKREEHESHRITLPPVGEICWFCSVLCDCLTLSLLPNCSSLIS